MNYDDSLKGGYSYAEKLAMVANEQMDPKEIGLVSSDEAQMLLNPVPKPERKLGDYVTFEASPVPMDLRMEWAYEELKIVPPDRSEWEEKWKRENEGTFVIQARTRSGNALAQTSQTFKELIPGMIHMMREAAGLLEEEYAKETAIPAEQETTG